jgi:hypothetical protein
MHCSRYEQQRVEARKTSGSQGDSRLGFRGIREAENTFDKGIEKSNVKNTFIIRPLDFPKLSSGSWSLQRRTILLALAIRKVVGEHSGENIAALVLMQSGEGI